MATGTATFGAGCFWGVEAVFGQVAGVMQTAVGYMGGRMASPSYHDVCTDRTGHAEVVQVEYDPQRVSYERLLEVFFGCHNPTQRNRQGPDVGRQYRSVIFYHSEEQEAAALAARQKAAAKLGRPVATEIEPAATFWRAEEYHQKYYEKHGGVSCHLPQE